MAALRPWAPAFIHGDLQIAHVFVDDGDEVVGIIDWSGAAPGDPMLELLRTAPAAAATPV
ncbi:phosphotransferase [Brachybacterium fresconis]|uniref:phosphotransferase n=1 Tax=Brachybacterium fresconis TaxID=173363 RepID=UPI003159E2A8